MLRAFAKQKPRGQEAEIVALLDGEDSHYIEMETALLWGDSPFEFMARGGVERAVMSAHFREKRLRKAHVDHVQNQIMDKKAKDKPGSSMSSQHDAFFGG